MSLGITLKTATSGLMAAQAGLRAVSDNIANVNTPGYVRKTVDQRPMVVNGTGMGVEVTGISRVTDQYLQLASLTATSDASRWDVYSSTLDNAQSLYGDPSSNSFFFNRLDDVYSAFATSANDPSSTLLRTQSLSAVQNFIGDAQRINNQVVQLGQTMDSQIQTDVSRANDLLAQINRLNSDITRAKLVDQDASGSENIQTGLVDELAGIMNIRVNQRSGGGIDIRSAEGVKLAGDGAATLSYVRTDSTKGYISATQAGGVGAPQPIQIDGGELRGLMDLRNDKLPGMSDQLGEFVSQAVDQLNAAHNAASAVPPPATLTGRNTGLDMATALGGFSGQTTVAILNASGVVQKRVDIDFTAGTMAVDGGPPGPFSPATFDTDLTAALGGAGSASFTNGALTISANGGNGVAIDEGSSSKTGRGFSHFLGLNDLVRSTGFTTYETGLKPTDAHGFNPGDQIVLRLAAADGNPIRDVTVTVPAAPLMSDLLNSLNNSSTGVGLYGQFNLDANGALAFTGSAPAYASMSIVQDNTQRGTGGPSIGQLFGLGVTERSARVDRFVTNPALVADPTKVATAHLDLTVAAGQPALRPGDGSGALALSTSGDVNTQFQAAGSLGAVNMSVSRYASEFGGAIGREAAAADTRKQSAASVQTEATARRQAVEGVNLDEELVKLTTYQQAFNASARMIQATKDLFDVLTNMV
ncbi:flagellar hook-associated protein FlgK [Phenylobacterium hankyongense]|uniref:Flagellar hook-associated protein 1 n=1 Tax=Phenylobacterium hankyongense TaxID=1813876 RepID=A0A328AZW6_9CAUL|nr:flagellar hook-associated protein FlgK [Phenylobacterium hankyongense]RAK60473.1 flagellar hook-associated protein FlgK [Phenylobacterium hankyongense]